MRDSRHNSAWFNGVDTLRLPKAIQTAYAIERIIFRPFGIAEPDLDVDFRQPSVPALVTDILECCATSGNGKPPERGLLWELQVGTRIESLWRIVSLSGAFEAAFIERCRNEACGEPLEFELSLDDLLSLQDESGEFVSVQCGDETLVLRKPTGADQRDWAARESPNDLASIESLLQTLIVSDSETLPRLHYESLALVDQAMQAADSLVDFSLELICPHCESRSEFEVDLQTLAIQRLEHRQRKLLTTVYRLASHYHWSEQQIFAVPPWRRDHYLKMLEAETK